jgi:hypothetical protein
MRDIKRIVVHVSDSPDNREDIDAAEIDRWHKQNGWSGIGYHKIVIKGGAIENGRPESVAGAHVAGHNADTLAICWVGRNDCQDAQKESMKKQILEWCDKYGISIDDVYGHYELAPGGKTCPNLDMNEFRDYLKKKASDAEVERDPVSDRKKEYLPNGPSEDSIDVTLEDIENQILDD